MLPNSFQHLSIVILACVGAYARNPSLSRTGFISPNAAVTDVAV